jgi:hypothetical protein
MLTTRNSTGSTCSDLLNRCTSMTWMSPSLSLAMEAGLHAARLQLRKMPQDQLLAEAERFMVTATVNHNLLSQAMRRVSELELREAVNSVDTRQQQLSAEGLKQRPRWPWSR